MILGYVSVRKDISPLKKIHLWKISFQEGLARLPSKCFTHNIFLQKHSLAQIYLRQRYLWVRLPSERFPKISFRLTETHPWQNSLLVGAEECEVAWWTAYLSISLKSLGANHWKDYTLPLVTAIGQLWPWPRLGTLATPSNTATSIYIPAAVVQLSSHIF